MFVILIPAPERDINALLSDYDDPFYCLPSPYDIESDIQDLDPDAWDEIGF